MRSARGGTERPPDTDTPATLYGPVSLGFGVIAVIAAFLLGPFGVLAGSLAVTFGILGLVGRIKVNRLPCAIGLVTGAFGVLYPVSLLLLYTGGF
ncbi:hypothetical protein GL263_16765 [Streptomyces durbertensis]|uniref:DUF4190 domain-containing protein n=1 Tax=Streptomyces durbertensis TaxID=2448886 RepID=A0ABR6EIP5_9ACTN|nr:hypothetical protein [Streptomyces durbertensis]MBB1245211.1 hypothetical protein [Streptomyces durbertensis]